MVQVSLPSDGSHVAPPGLAVAVYPVIEDPPLLSGESHVTTMLESPAVPATFFGAPGRPKGFTPFDAGEAGDEPRALVAFTVKVYSVVAVRPVKSAESSVTVFSVHEGLHATV